MINASSPQSGRNDPDVVIPEAIRRQNKNIEDYYKQATSGQAPAEQKATAPQPLENGDASQNEQQAQAPKEKAGEIDYKHQYLSNKGRWERAEAKAAQLAEQVDSLRSIIAQSAAAPVSSGTGTTTRLVTDQEIEDFGPDLIDVARRLAQEETANLRSQLSEVTSKLNAMANTTVVDARQRMLDRLGQEIPEWNALNENPEFLAWLGLPDVFSGVIRHDMLKAAYERNDASRVVAFFKGFLQEKAVVGVAPTTKKAQAETPAPKMSLEEFAAPGRGGTSSTATAGADEPPTITTHEIATFYADCAAGRYDKKPEEKLRIERAIFAAQAKGRIIR